MNRRRTLKKLRVLVAEDHQIVRDGLRLLIDGQSDMQVIAEAGDGNEVLLRASELKPDVVVMDLSMPNVNGLQATKRLKAEQPDVKVVALTVHEDPSYLVQLCQAGAVGYVLKRSAGDDLIHAIRTVAGGGLHFDAALANKALIGRAADVSNRPGGRPADLSEREKEVLVMVAWGYSNKEIAAELHLSTKTVETYRVRVNEKLGFRSRTEIVQYALRQGWLNETHPLAKPAR